MCSYLFQIVISRVALEIFENDPQTLKDNVRLIDIIGCNHDGEWP